MFNMGIGELIIVMIIALVFLGPEKFPVFAKTALRAFRDLRGYYDEIRGDVLNELKPFKKDLKELSRYKPEDYIEAFGTTVESEKQAAAKRAEEAKASEQMKAAQASSEEPAPQEPPEPVPGTEPRSKDYPYTD